MSEKKKNTTSDSLSVSISRSTLGDNGIEILKAVIKSKEGLFRKAFGSEKMDIIVDDEKTPRSDSSRSGVPGNRVRPLLPTSMGLRKEAGL